MTAQLTFMLEKWRELL